MSLIANFPNNCKKTKIELIHAWKDFEFKSHQRRANDLNLFRNRGQIIAGAGGAPSSNPLY